MRQLAIRKPNATRRLPEFLTHHRNNPNNHNNPFQALRLPALSPEEEP